jgi:hypothetical protein
MTKLSILGATLALVACSQTEPAAAQHRSPELCVSGWHNIADIPTSNPSLAAYGRATDTVHECIWRNAIAFADSRETAETVGKAVNDACSRERGAMIASEVVAFGNAVDASRIEEDTQRQLDRDAMVAVVRVRAGHCNLPD